MRTHHRETVASNLCLKRQEYRRLRRRKRQFPIQYSGKVRLLIYKESHGIRMLYSPEPGKPASTGDGWFLDLWTYLYSAESRLYSRPGSCLVNRYFA